MTPLSVMPPAMVLLTKCDAGHGRDRAGVGDVAGEGRTVAMTPAPPTGPLAEMVPVALLTMPPVKLETAVTKMPRTAAETVPLLVMPPVKVETPKA